MKTHQHQSKDDGQVMTEEELGKLEEIPDAVEAPEEPSQDPRSTADGAYPPPR